MIGHDGVGVDGATVFGLDATSELSVCIRADAAPELAALGPRPSPLRRRRAAWHFSGPLMGPERPPLGVFMSLLSSTSLLGVLVGLGLTLAGCAAAGKLPSIPLQSASVLTSGSGASPATASAADTTSTAPRASRLPEPTARAGDSVRALPEGLCHPMHNAPDWYVRRPDVPGFFVGTGVAIIQGPTLSLAVAEAEAAARASLAHEVRTGVRSQLARVLTEQGIDDRSSVRRLSSLRSLEWVDETLEGIQIQARVCDQTNRLLYVQARLDRASLAHQLAQRQAERERRFQALGEALDAGVSALLSAGPPVQRIILEPFTTPDVRGIGRPSPLGAYLTDAVADRLTRAGVLLLSPEGSAGSARTRGADRLQAARDADAHIFSGGLYRLEDTLVAYLRLLDPIRAEVVAMQAVEAPLPENLRRGPGPVAGSDPCATYLEGYPSEDWVERAYAWGPTGVEARSSAEGQARERLERRIDLALRSGTLEARMMLANVGQLFHGPPEAVSRDGRPGWGACAVVGVNQVMVDALTPDLAAFQDEVDALAQRIFDALHSNSDGSCYLRLQPAIWAAQRSIAHAPSELLLVELQNALAAVAGSGGRSLVLLEPGAYRPGAQELRLLLAAAGPRLLLSASLHSLDGDAGARPVRGFGFLANLVGPVPEIEQRGALPNVSSARTGSDDLGVWLDLEGLTKVACDGDIVQPTLRTNQVARVRLFSVLPDGTAYQVFPLDGGDDLVSGERTLVGLGGMRLVRLPEVGEDRFVAVATTRPDWGGLLDEAEGFCRIPPERFQALLEGPVAVWEQVYRMRRPGDRHCPPSKLFDRERAAALSLIEQAEVCDGVP